MSELEIAEKRKVHFDGTITLGHILTALMMAGAMVTMYVNFKVIEADHEARLKALEATSKEFRETTKQLTDNQTMGIRNLDHLTNLFERLPKP